MTQRAPLFDRSAKEAREGRELADWAMKSVNSQGRRFPEEEDDLRTGWERDRDRIVHCTGFRRLMYKTQVFVNWEGDHYRTRMSHSLEVEQVARSVGNALALNEPLCEAIALAHDIGPPPPGDVTLRLLAAGFGVFVRQEAAGIMPAAMCALCVVHTSNNKAHPRGQGPCTATGA